MVPAGTLQPLPRHGHGEIAPPGAPRTPGDGFRTRFAVRPTSTRGAGRAQAGDPLEDPGEPLPRDGDFRQLEDDVLRVRHHLGADLDQLLPQRRERPALDRLWQYQLPKEVGQVVGQREQRQSRLIVLEMPARQLDPLDRIFPLFYPLLLLPTILPPLSQLVTYFKPCASSTPIIDLHCLFYIPALFQDVASVW